MKDAPPWEREIGILYYLTDSEGSGGRIKETADDFIVEEVGSLGTAELLLLRGQKAPKRPEGSGRYLWVAMEKRDWATIDAVNRVARILKIPVKSVGFAGTKDKKAMTAQWISLRDVKWTDLRDLRLRDMEFHSPFYAEGRLRLGQLEGNRFTIRIRGARQIPHIRKFPNYFAHQRFGSYRFISHIVGRCIISGDWGGAVKTYLTATSDYEPVSTREARLRLLEEWGDFRRALEYFPERLRQEMVILRALAGGKGYESALRRLHPRMFSLFIHAYQSSLFNKILSRRLEYGIRPEKEDVLLHGTPTAMIPGFRSSFAGGVQGEIEREVIEEEGVELSDFRQFKKFATEGGRRKILESAGDFRVSSGVVSFYLPKGAYATALLREILKPSSPDGFLFTQGSPSG